MGRREKRLEAMRNNPKNDWTIGDVEAICRGFGVACKPPSGGGSHFTVSHCSQSEILTIPAHKPIKVVYIVKLVLFIDSVIGSES